MTGLGRSRTRPGLSGNRPHRRPRPAGRSAEWNGRDGWRQRGGRGAHAQQRDLGHDRPDRRRERAVVLGVQAVRHVPGSTRRKWESGQRAGAVQVGSAALIPLGQAGRARAKWEMEARQKSWTMHRTRERTQMRNRPSQTETEERVNEPLPHLSTASPQLSLPRALSSTQTRAPATSRRNTRTHART
jgi:hypothetical protein